MQEEPHHCSGSGEGDTQQIYEEEDCHCETEQLVSSASDTDSQVSWH